MVPKDHLLRQIDEAIDFSFIYDLVKDSYCADNGRPSLDPVMFGLIDPTEIFVDGTHIKAAANTHIWLAPS